MEYDVTNTNEDGLGSLPDAARHAKHGDAIMIRVCSRLRSQLPPATICRGVNVWNVLDDEESKQVIAELARSDNTDEL